MNTNAIPFRMPEKLYRKLKIFSAKHDISVNELILNALSSDFKISKNNDDLFWDGYKLEETKIKK